MIPKCKHIKHCHSYKHNKNRNIAGFSASRPLILISSGVVGLSWVLPGQLLAAAKSLSTFCWTFRPGTNRILGLEEKIINKQAKNTNQKTTTKWQEKLAKIDDGMRRMVEWIGGMVRELPFFFICCNPRGVQGYVFIGL